MKDEMMKFGSTQLKSQKIQLAWVKLSLLSLKHTPPTYTRTHSFSPLFCIQCSIVRSNYYHSLSLSLSLSQSLWKLQNLYSQHFRRFGALTAYSNTNVDLHTHTHRQTFPLHFLLLRNKQKDLQNFCSPVSVQFNCIKTLNDEYIYIYTFYVLEWICFY